METVASLDENPEIVQAEADIKQPIIGAIEMLKKNGLLNLNISSKWIITVMYGLLFDAWKEIQAGNLAKNDATEILLITILQGFAR